MISLDRSELERLAQEIPLSTPEAFPPNDFYGSATVLKRIAGLPDEFVLRGILPHGPSLSSKVWDLEVDHPLQSLLLVSPDQQPLYAQRCSKSVSVIGSPLLYLQRDCEAELASLRSSANGTIAFPTHSTHHVTAQFDEDDLLQTLRTLPDHLQPVRVCLYWRDIQLGRHLRYLDAGLECTTAGHMFDRHQFWARLARILAHHRFAFVNKLGSAAIYAAAAQLPVLIHSQDTHFDGAHPRYLSELSPTFDLPLADALAATASLPLDQAAPLQRRLADRLLGRASLLSPANLRALLESLPPLPTQLAAPSRRPSIPSAPTPAPVPNPQPPVAPLFSGSIADVLDQLKGNLARYPRRTPGTLEIDGRTLRYADLHSFYHQSRQIFANHLYDFSTPNPHPLIIDGGAHIGLASLAFARRHPGAVILAFEADPDIAALLSDNVRSLDLPNVHVQAQALWTHDRGVAFDRSGDDSGHVSPSAAPRVPSVRLRDLLARQPVDLLKLDIEGAEFAVIQDCDGILDRAQHLVIEVHRFRDDDGRLGNLLSVLERNGFEYALADLHPAEWIASPTRPPFAACKSRHYIVSVFAWIPANRAQPVPSTSSPTPRPVLSQLEAARLAVSRYNAGHLDQALATFESIPAPHSKSANRWQLGQALTLARLGRATAAQSLLAQQVSPPAASAPSASTPHSRDSAWRRALQSLASNRS